MSDEDLLFTSAVDLAAMIRERKVSPVEVVDAVLHRIDHVNLRLNAFCTLHADEARTAAKRAEEAVVRGEALGPLHGVPVSVKDIIDVAGSRTTYGSRLFEDHVPTADAPAIERIRAAGAILIGRTTTPEFGWKGVTDSPLFGITRNPWNADCTPGGSSGGAAAAVAAGMGPIGIGTDGGGSLRIPASFCNVVGYKPSFGRVPGYPPTTVDALRHTGPLTRTVADAALVLDVLAGPDERDPTSLPARSINYLEQMDGSIEGLRIAWSGDLGSGAVDAEVLRVCQAAVRRFEQAGAIVESVDLDWEDPYECWRTMFYGGLSARLERTLEEDAPYLDPGLFKVVVAGTILRGRDVVEAQLARNAYWQRVRVLFDQYDLLATPTLPVPPFSIGQDQANPPEGVEWQPGQWFWSTYPFNLTGQPAVSVPCGWTEAQLPVGLQLVGPRYGDESVLRAAHAFEQIQPWHARPDLDWNWPVEGF